MSLGYEPICPFKFAERLWPKIKFYREQQQVIESVLYTPETVVVAGNMLGKDFVAGYICLYWLLTGGGKGFDVETRVVTTSVNDRHLRVLWGEIRRFINRCAVPLRVRDGGPLIVNHRDIFKVVNGKRDEVSYLAGMVAGEDMEGLAGHHAESTLAVIDEASGVDDLAYEKMQGWAKRFLIFGNPHECQNFFRKMVEGGDVLDDGTPVAKVTAGEF